MLATIVAAPIFVAIYFGGFLAMALVAAAIGDEDAAGVIFAMGMPVLILAMLLLAAPLGVVLTPVLIRVGLAQDFATAINFAWLKSFVAKVWKEMLLGTLF